MNKKVILLTSIVTSLEVYDFLIYSFLVKYLSKVFFVANDPMAVFIETLIMFSVGYIARPLGGGVIGALGDKFGRKKAFIISIQGLSIATLAIAFLPSYATLGITSPILLTFLRITQGYVIELNYLEQSPMLLNLLLKKKKDSHLELFFVV